MALQKMKNNKIVRKPQPLDQLSSSLDQCTVQKVPALRCHSLNNYLTIILPFQGNHIIFTGMGDLCCHLVNLSKIIPPLNIDLHRKAVDQNL